MLKAYLSTFALMIPDMPTADDWQEKIDKVVDEYHNKTIHLPRKAKKKRRKELNSQYNFYMGIKNWDPLNDLFK